jgi:hypothetical protein
MINMNSAVKEFRKALKINIALLCKTVSHSVWEDAGADRFKVRPVLGIYEYESFTIENGNGN